MRNLRLLLLPTWAAYPIAYLAPVLGFDGAGAVVAIQSGYTIADILAEPFFGALTMPHLAAVAWMDVGQH